MKITTRLLLSFLLVSILPLVVVDYAVLRSIDRVGALAVAESASALNQLGEQSTHQKALDVARQMELYLEVHPALLTLPLPSWQADKELASIAVQPVGRTGYTAVHDNRAINYFHINPAIMGTDLYDLAGEHPAFWVIVKDSLDGTVASGYYDWKDADGAVRDKYMTIVPVGRTFLRVAATTYIDEFSLPAKETGTKIVSVSQRVQRNLLVALCVVGALSAGLGLVLARRMISPVTFLVRGAERVAHGQLDQPVPVHNRDELGLLAEAFNTMQAGLRASRLELEEHARTLEQRVEQRTAELQGANAALAWHAIQLETSSQVSKQATSILDLDELLAQVVHSIQSRFGYYFVGVWLLSDQHDYASLRAGSRQVGKQLAQRDVCIPTHAASIIAGVCKTGVHRLVSDVSQAADYLLVEELPDARSELALPLRMSGTTIGVLDVLSDAPAAFEAGDVLVLQTLADQIAIAIRNAQFYKVEQTRRRLAESLERAGRELVSDLDFRQVPGRILEQLLAVVPYERGSVMLQEGDATRVVAQRGFPTDERVKGLRMPIRAGDVFQQVVDKACPVLLDDVTQEAGWQQVSWLPLDRSWLGVPLISKGRVIGMISLTRREAGAFSADDATLASAFAGQAAIALENASLYDEISRFNEQLEQMVQERTEELDKAYQNLERLDKTKSDFIEVAAHELRTPLTLIKGHAQLLANILQGHAEARPLLDGILSGQSRLNEIITSMLDVSKIDSQALDMSKERMRLSDVVGAVQAGFKPIVQERQLALSVIGLDDLPVIQADPRLLYKVFYHLIVNAIKYTPDGGEICVSGKSIAETPEGPMVEITVRDTGIGIDPAHQELIFEKFYQTGRVSFHSSGKTKFKGGGPGLGLSIVRGIIHAHTGRIWVESEGYDEKACPGSAFHVLLPVSSVEKRPGIPGY